MAGRVIAWAEPLYLIAIAPLLLFPGFRPAWTAVALGGLALLWTARGLIRRETWPVTPYNVALLVFCLSIPVAVAVSPARELTIPRLTGLILGIGALRAVGFSARTPYGLRLALLVFGLVGLAIWSVGLLGVGLSLAHPIMQKLPPSFWQIIAGDDQAVNPNVLAGGIVPYLPVSVTLAAYCVKMRRWGWAALLGFAALVIGVTLVYTRSRSGVIGAGASLLLLAFLFAWFRVRRRERVALIVALVVLSVVGITAGAMLLLRVMNQDQIAQGAAAVGTSLLSKELSPASRVEIWSRAVYALQDFPFTGIGLGAFPRVIPLLYPLFLVSPDTPVGHAHNILLQTGLDFGLIGLVGYAALIIASAASAWQAARACHSVTHYLALGLLAGLIGVHLYGLTDSLEAKPAIVLWLLLGLIAALPLASEKGYGAKRPDF